MSSLSIYASIHASIYLPLALIAIIFLIISCYFSLPIITYHDMSLSIMIMHSLALFIYTHL